MKNDTTVERNPTARSSSRAPSTRPRALVFEAWTKPELMRRWWVPKSSGLTLLSCEMDVRTGGGTASCSSIPPRRMRRWRSSAGIVEVSPHSRLVWTNDESGDAGQLSTLTLEDRGDTTRIVLLEVYPSGEAYEAAKGAYDGMPESFAQLDELLAG